MNTHEIEEWGEKLTQEVYQNWLTWKNNYSAYKEHNG